MSRIHSPGFRNQEIASPDIYKDGPHSASQSGFVPGMIRRWCALLVSVLACSLMPLLMAGCGYVVNGSATGPLGISPDIISFGSVPVGQTANAMVTLTNESPGPIVVSQINVAGENFSATSQSSLPFTLKPGGTFQFQVSFKPVNGAAYAGQVTAMNNASKQIAELPLSGSGIGGPPLNPILAVSATSLTFGNVAVGSTATQVVTLSSTGGAPVTINAMALTGSGFTVVGGAAPATLNPGQTSTLQVQFDPTKSGSATGQLAFQSNSTTTPPVINLSGTGTASTTQSVESSQLTLNATDLAFGNVAVGSPATQSFTLTSTGTAPVTINSAAVTGTGFTLTGSAFPLALSPGQTLTLQVQFDPASAGSAAGQVAINSNSSTNGSAVVDLSGAGIVAANPLLTVSTANLTFGDQTVGSPSTQPVTLTSTGTAPVTISTATISGSSFTVLGSSLPATLSPGQALTLQIQFDPTAAGSALGQLTINSNSSNNSAAGVVLSGIGIPAPSPQLSVSAASLTFGDVTVGSSSTQPVTLTSTGTAPVTINTEALSGAGFTLSGAAFPSTLNPGQAVTLQIQFDPSATGTATGQLTITSDSATSSTAVVTLNGIGTAAPSPQLTVSAASLSFGNVTVGSSSTQPVTLASTGTAPVTITVATLSGAGFSASGLTFPLTLNPGQTATLQVQFDPSTAGAATGQVTISSDSSTSSMAIVNLNGTGIPAPSPQLTLSTATLSFGSVTVGSASTQPVTLTSTGTVPVTINSGVLSGTGFTATGINFPITLNPGQTATLLVQFAPASVGAATGQFTLTSNASSSTAIVGLTGSGTAALSPQLTVSTGSISFGDVTVGSSSTQPITLSSTGTAPVTINSSTVTGAAFTAVGINFPVTLNPGQTATLQVEFDPNSTGAASGQLAISSNSSGSGSAMINLSGTGTPAPAPQISLSTASLSFGNISVGTSSSQSLTINSTGTAPLTISTATLSGAGFSASGLTLPVTLNPGQSATLQVQFDPSSTGAVTGQLTIQSNSSNGSTAVVSLNGTGTAAPGVLQSVSCSSASVTGATSDGCTVTLTAPAGGGGLVIGLASSDTALTVPSSVMVAANSTSVGFTATAAAVSSSQTATLTASSGSISKSTTLQLNAAVPTLSVSSTSLAFGTVALNTPSTEPLTISSTGTASVTINAITITGSGFSYSGGSIPATLNPGQTLTIEVQFDPTASGGASGQLSINSNSSTGNAAISLNGTGQSVAHQVDLSWLAPTSSPVPIVGYNIYRATGGSTTYQLLNSSIDPQTSYVDNTVQDGQSYDYYVTSVDSSNVESGPSNEVAATIP